MDSHQPEQAADAAAQLYDETISSSPEIYAAQRIALHAERLEPVVQRVQGRRAIVTRRPVTVRKLVEVDLVHEELVITYVDGDGSPVLDDGDSPTLVVRLRAEEAEIVKHVRVVEEVRIGKRLVRENRRLSGTVRHETLDVDAAVPGSTEPPG